MPIYTGEKQYKFDEFLPVYQAIIKEKEGGTFADYMEAFKTFDREGQGVVSAAELRHVLSGYGELWTLIFISCVVTKRKPLIELLLLLRRASLR